MREGCMPIHGVRCNPVGDTCGWYIWSGEWSDDPNFFEPLCVQHLDDRCPDIVRYLALPPGWRFLWAEGYEDVWEDPNVEL